MAARAVGATSDQVMAEVHLTLNWVVRKARETWSAPIEGLSFLFPAEGDGLYQAGSWTGRVRPGDVLVLQGALPGELCAGQGKGIRFRFFSVNEEQLLPLFGSRELSFWRSIKSVFARPKVYAAASALAQKCARMIEEVSLEPGLEQRSQLLRVAGAILMAESQTARPRPAVFLGADERVGDVLDKISATEILGSSVEELSRRFGVSGRHLHRLFRQRYGLSVCALKMEMRLLRAMGLLRDPAAKVTSVAENCGFNHLGFFNTRFKKRFGLSPGQCRKGAVPVDHKCILRAKDSCPWAR